MTIEEAKSDKQTLEIAIRQAVQEFEAKYGEGTFFGLTFKRWNGSNSAFGKVVSVRADVRLLDGESVST